MQAFILKNKFVFFSPVAYYSDKVLTEIFVLDFFDSFFVKKKRKENRIIFQFEIIVRNMNLIKILIGGKKRDMKF